MPRWVFDRFGPFREGCYGSDGAFGWKVAAELGRPLLDPGLEVRHFNYTGLRRVATKLFAHGRAFAELRVSTARWGPVRKGAFALASPVLPFLLFARVARNALSSTGHRRPFLGVAPFVFLGLGVWSAGEVAGVLRGRRGG